MRHELRRPYVSVKRGQIRSYGGSQAWCRRKYWQKSACGLIACADFLLYREKVGTEGAILPEEEYQKVLEHLSWRYFPVLPGVGMIGIFLAAGLNFYFMRHRIGLRCGWGWSRRKLWSRLEEMLDADLPVILAIGPNIPFRFAGHKLNLYTRGADGRLRVTARTSAHYVNVTGMDGEWLRISSWGREYYMRRAEYRDYAAKYSSFLVCNVVYVRERKTGRFRVLRRKK